MARNYPKGKRDPSSHRTREQIHNMDHGYNARPDIVKNREERNQARAIMRRRRGAAAIRGKDVNHIRKVIDGGTNSPSNLNIETPHKNRGWERDE